MLIVILFFVIAGFAIFNQIQQSREKRLMATVADVLAATTALTGQISALQSDLNAFIAAEGVLPDLTPAIAAINSIATSVAAMDQQVKTATPVPPAPAVP